MENAENCDAGPCHSVTECVAAELTEKSRTQLYPERGVSKPDIDERRLKFNRLIGGGAFSDVFEVDYIPGPGFDLDRKQKVAVKLLKLEDRNREREVVDFVREIQVMRQLPERSYFVPYLGTGCLDRGNTKSMQKSLFIMMEYMNHGTLADLLVKQMARPRKPLFSRQQALNWLVQIAHALNTLHTATPMVMHRDVKAENIMLCEDEHGEFIAKLGDFGLHTCVAPLRPGAIRGTPVIPNRIVWEKDGADFDDGHEHEYQCWMPKSIEREYELSSPVSEDSARKLASREVKYRLTTRVGSYMYMAPEVFLEESYSEKADVFSFGMMMYELLNARLMLVAYSKLIEERGERLGVREYARRISRGWRPSLKGRLPDKINDLINRCWAHDASSRPSMTQVMHELEDIRANRSLETCSAVDDRSLSGVSRFFSGWLEDFWSSFRVVLPCHRCFRGQAKPATHLREKLHRPDLEVTSL